MILWLTLESLTRVTKCFSCLPGNLVPKSYENVKKNVLTCQLHLFELQFCLKSIRPLYLYQLSKLPVGHTVLGLNCTDRPS